jgi:hypothetical protein
MEAPNVPPLSSSNSKGVMKINLAIVVAAASVLLPVIPLTASGSLLTKTTNKTAAVCGVRELLRVNQNTAPGAARGAIRARS